MASSEQPWQDRFDELAYPSSFVILGALMTYGKVTGWTVPSHMRFGGVLELLYNPFVIVAVFVIGFAWLVHEL